MTRQELESQLHKHGGKPWRDYMRRKEGFISSVMEDSFKAGKRLTRAKAVRLWDERLKRENNY